MRGSRDALRRKAASLLRDWGSCPECGERGTLVVSVPALAGKLVVLIDCRSPCGMKKFYPSTYLVTLGGVADSVRRRLELEASDWSEETVVRKMGEILRDRAAEEEAAAVFRFSWDDLMGRRR